jgi:hypothetical protein
MRKRLYEETGEQVVENMLNDMEAMKNIIKDELEAYFNRIPDSEIVAELYPDNYREDAFVVNVKREGLPDFEEIIGILSKKHNIPVGKIDEWFEENYNFATELMWNTIEDIRNDLGKRIGKPVYAYGRMGGYWGVPLDEIEIEVREPTSKEVKEIVERYRKEKLEEFYKEYADELIKETPPVIESHLIDHFATWFYYDMLLKGRIDFFDFIVFKDNFPEKFIKMVKETTKMWGNQHLWAEIYEDYILEDLRGT